jgi:hypothetical protein
MQKSELTTKETKELEKSVASDLKKKDDDDKFKESVKDTTKTTSNKRGV